jgi:hypothetical protein
MESAGDVRSMVIGCNRDLRSWGLRPVTNFQALCREITGMRFGELARRCAEQELKRYSAEWFEAARRRVKGQRAGFPRRRRRHLPVRFRHGLFRIEGRRVRLVTARGSPELSYDSAERSPTPRSACARSLSSRMESDST